MNSLVTFAPFTSNAWMAFSGAESFADGSDPLIACFKSGSFNAVAIVDAHGLTITLDSDDGDTYAVVGFQGAYAARAMGTLRDGAEFSVLMAMPGAQDYSESFGDDIEAQLAAWKRKQGAA